MAHTTPQPLYNTIVGVQANFRVSYPICVITRVKCIAKKDKNSAEVDIAPAFSEITTACNVGQATTAAEK